MTSIFVISSHLMFAHGLDSLLSRDGQAEILGHESNMERASEQIEYLQPDVVILDSSALYQPGSEVVSMLDISPNSKVVKVDLHSNKLSVYQASHQVVESLSDLFKIISTQENGTQKDGHKH